MASDDKLTFLEQLSNALAGETLTGGARAVGEAIGYVGAGGDFSDVPQVMKDAIEAQKKRLETGSQGEKDAYSALSALGLVTNPVSQIGMGIDFAKALPSLVSAIPERVKAYMAGTPDPAGTIAEGGLKRRLAKGGAQAEFARANQLKRARANIAGRKDLSGRSINPPLAWGYVDAFMPIQSKNANWGPGEGKFQVIDDYSTQAYDLAKKTSNPLSIGMGNAGNFGSAFDVIKGNPHDLGIEFANTIGLAPEYRGKGYGKAIYQNMADVYGGGISHSGSTTPEARRVYESLGAIDTGIPSYGGTRQALPTTAMKNDPEAMAAFEAKVKEYAKRSPQTSLESAIDNLGSRDRQYLDRELESLAGRSNGYVHESEISDLLSELYSIDLTGRNIPAKLELDSGTWIREPNRAFYKRLP
jgi:GNAT superfamily N-acetyltransferase